MSSGLLTFTVFLGAAGLYLICAGQVGGTEGAAGIPAAGLAAAYAGLLHRGEARPMRLRAPWLRLLLSSIASVVSDVARVGVQLLRAVLVPGSHVAGTVSRQPFRPGGTGPADAGRRALVTLASSLAPNGFVLDVAPSELLRGERALLMHRLAPGRPDPDGEWPV